MDIGNANWRVEIWAEDEDFRLRRDDRVRERVRIMNVSARTADEARQLALGHHEVRRRWPRANAAVFPAAG
ncbi:MAG: hypothetical protein WAO20_14985 [Acidobacteriota bacterium]